MVAPLDLDPRAACQTTSVGLAVSLSICPFRSRLPRSGRWRRTPRRRPIKGRFGLRLGCGLGLGLGLGLAVLAVGGLPVPHGLGRVGQRPYPAKPHRHERQQGPLA